jgi:hypothetical protein
MVQVAKQELRLGCGSGARIDDAIVGGQINAAVRSMEHATRTRRHHATSTAKHNQIKNSASTQRYGIIKESPLDEGVENACVSPHLFMSLSSSSSSPHHTV